MKLLTKKLCQTIPPLYAQDGKDDPIVHCKFFHPMATATWLVTEGSVMREGEALPLTEYEEGDEVHFFGYAELQPGCGELGYSSLKEILGIRVLGLSVERDRHFEPCPLSEAKVGL